MIADPTTINAVTGQNPGPKFVFGLTTCCATGPSFVVKRPDLARCGAILTNLRLTFDLRSDFCREHAHPCVDIGQRRPHPDCAGTGGERVAPLRWSRNTALQHDERSARRRRP